jgi:hypothetical protein
VLVVNETPAAVPGIGDVTAELPAFHMTADFSVRQESKEHITLCGQQQR